MVSSTGSDGKYHRCLPSHADPEARSVEKLQRKEARRLAKSAAAAKRQVYRIYESLLFNYIIRYHTQVKIPKHIKKKAMKAGSKNKK